MELSEKTMNDVLSKVIVPENKNQLKKVLEIVDKCPSLEKIIVMEEKDAAGHPKVMSFKDLMELGWRKYAEDPSLFEKLSQEVTVGELATIVYTSGTTGLPKGAMITHGNIFWVVQSLKAIKPPFASDKDCTVPFLPLSHV